MAKKSHSGEGKHPALSSGVKHSRLISSGFNWRKATDRALDTRLRRAISLARCNPDYQLKYPNECRDNPTNEYVRHCHPEAEKRIIKEHMIILRKSLVPQVEKPVRFNRVG